MKTMKENWSCPDVQVQVFSPQEFVATCAGYENAFKAKCMNGISALFFTDATGDWVSDGCRGGCGREHLFEAAAGDDLEKLRNGNCWVLAYVHTSTPYIGSDNTSWYISNGYLTKSGNNYTIPTTEKVNELKAGIIGYGGESVQLVRGYYDPDALDDNVLLTVDLQHIVPAS